MAVPEDGREMVVYGVDCRCATRLQSFEHCGKRVYRGDDGRVITSQRNYTLGIASTWMLSAAGLQKRSRLQGADGLAIKLPRAPDFLPGSHAECE